LPAKKTARQQVRRYQRNQSIRRATRTAFAGARKAIESGDQAVAESAVRHAMSVLDKATKKGILHKNNTSRHKSRLAARFNRMREGATS
jgi:small subunit ribosomal protein S20